MKLHQVAHSRSGDKGNVSNISVIAHDERDYPFLVEHVTCERVRAHFGDFARGELVRHECPAIGALNFVLHGALTGGVTRSLSLDAHGKSLSSLMLNLDLPEYPGPAHAPDSGAPKPGPAPDKSP
jgi:hypothetical protein